MTRIRWADRQANAPQVRFLHVHLKRLGLLILCVIMEKALYVVLRAVHLQKCALSWVLARLGA